jgi:hypothetical protein
MPVVHLRRARILRCVPNPSPQLFQAPLVRTVGRIAALDAQITAQEKER